MHNAPPVHERFADVFVDYTVIFFARQALKD
jgi:hypothetical protein